MEKRWTIIGKMKKAVISIRECGGQLVLCLMKEINTSCKTEGGNILHFSIPSGYIKIRKLLVVVVVFLNDRKKKQ